jgi:hypothetical protein
MTTFPPSDGKGVAESQPLQSPALIPVNAVFQGIPVRIVTVDGVQMMPVVDIGRALKINRGTLTRSLGDKHLADKKRDCRVATPGGSQKMVCITSLGAVGLLYKVDAEGIEDEKLKEKISEFQNWATNLVKDEMQIQAKLPVQEARTPTGQVGEVMRRHFEAAMTAHLVMGIPLELARSKALFHAGNELKMDLTGYAKLQNVADVPQPRLPAPASVVVDWYKSAGEIANLLNRRNGGHLRGMHINKYLKTHGYIYKNEEGRWCMTDLGTRYGKLAPYVDPVNGHTGYHLRWHQAILKDSGLIRD